MKVDHDGIYEGIEIYKNVNKNIEHCIKFFKDQMLDNDLWKSKQIYEMLDIIEERVKIKLED